MRAPLAVLAVAVAHAAHADHFAPEELLVTASRDTRTIDIAESIDLVSDAAQLLKKAPGANVNGNGPLSGIPQYRGMYGTRVQVTVNGDQISSGGPNWMDPPLSYAPAAQLESLQIYRGIAPVSAGQETIGGAINAKTWQGEFGTGEAFSSQGRIRLGAQSVNDSWQASAAVVAANKNHRIKVAGLLEQGDDAEFDGGDIIASEFDRQRVDVGYGFKTGGHTVQLDAGRNETGDTGTAALAMDIEYIDSDLASLSYRFEGEGWQLDSRLYYSDIEHGMTNYHLRQPPASLASYRRNLTSADNWGFKLNSRFNDEHGAWLLGVDGHSAVHNSDIDNPNSATFFVTNFNDIERNVLGVFAEREQRWSQAWSGEFGLRYNRVSSDADEVDGTPAMMMAGRMLRDNFNNADRSQTDNNIDWVAKLYYQSSEQLTYSLGLARKTRSASYQERYLWLPLQATAGLADGYSYTGNIELDPEVAHEIELGFDWAGSALSISPRLFYRDVDDYIQGTPSTNAPAVMFVRMMNTMNGSNNPDPLEFNNVEAKLYGFDVDWQWQLAEHWSLDGVINYVRGKRKDISDDLYRIAPLNSTLALNYDSNRWGATVESVLVSKQDRVSTTNGEQKTAGYGLLNLRGYWQLDANLRLGFGVENALDKRYQDHLAGYNRVMGNPDIAPGERLYGYGRNLFVRADYQW